MLKKISLFFLLFISTVPLQGDSPLFPCDLPPFALAPPERFAPCCNFEGHIDYLYMKGKISDGLQTGSDFVSDNSLVTNNIISVFENGTLSSTEVYTDWSGGFDIGIGWNFPSDRWALTFDYLHYSANSTFQLPFQTNFLTNLISFDGAPFQTNYPSFYSNQYYIGSVGFEMNFNLLELCAKKTFLVGPSLTLKPKAGLLAIFIREDFALNFVVDSNNGRTDIILPTLITSREHIEGIGVVMGLYSDWDLGCGFSLYGAFDCAAVSYHEKVQQNASSMAESKLGQPSTSFEVDQFDPLLKYQLGCSLQLPIGIQNTRFSLSLGWEAILFFNQDHLTAYTFSEAKALSVQGLTLSLALSI